MNLFTVTLSPHLLLPALSMKLIPLLTLCLTVNHLTIVIVVMVVHHVVAIVGIITHLIIVHHITNNNLGIMIIVPWIPALTFAISEILLVFNSPSFSVCLLGVLQRPSLSFIPNPHNITQLVS